MNKKFLIIGAIIFVSLIIISLTVFTIFSLNKNGFNQKRTNIIKLINSYYTQEEYDRVLKLIEDLLIQNADDKEIIKLQEKIIKAKNEKKQFDETTKNAKEQEEKQRLLEI